MTALLKSFSDHIKASKIAKETFYPKPNAFLSKEELLACFKAVNYPIQEEELDLLFERLVRGEPKLELKEFYDRLSCWKPESRSKESDLIAHLNSDILKVSPLYH